MNYRHDQIKGVLRPPTSRGEVFEDDVYTMKISAPWASTKTLNLTTSDVVSIANLLGYKDQNRKEQARLSPAVYDALSEAAAAIMRASDAWTDDDQLAFDASETNMGKAIGMSLDEAACEIFGFVDEKKPNG
jgi:hypothetical protein